MATLMYETAIFTGPDSAREYGHNERMPRQRQPRGFEPEGANLRVRDLRLEKGLSQEEMAAAAGVVQSTYGEWEVGRYPLVYNREKHRIAVEGMARLLGVSPDQIWNDPRASGYRVLPYAGEVSCQSHEYAGKIAGRTGSSQTIQMKVGHDLDVDEVVVAEDNFMAPRIPNGAKVAIKASGPLPGRICLVEQDEMIALYGAFKSQSKWVLATADDPHHLIPLTGKVIGIAVAVEVRTPDGSDVLEQKPAGIAFQGVALGQPFYR